jgi:hypothetical protein
VSQQINLYSPIFRRQKKYFSADTMMVSFGVIVLGVGALVTFAIMQVTALQSQAGQTAQQLKNDTARLTAMVADKSGENRAKALEARVKEAESSLAVKQRLSDALKSDSLGNTRGFSETMRALARQTLDGVWLTQIGVDGENNGLTLRGHALKAELVPEYVDRLRREKVLRGYSFGQLEMAAAGPGPSDGAPGAAGKAPAVPPGSYSFSLRAEARDATAEPPSGDAN